MTRLAHDRDTHLTPPEIAAEALRQFDENRSGGRLTATTGSRAAFHAYSAAPFNAD